MPTQVLLRAASVAPVTESTVLLPDRISQAVSRAQPVVAQSLSEEFWRPSPPWAPPGEEETHPSGGGLNIGEVAVIAPNRPRACASRISQIRFNHAQTVKNPYSRSVTTAYHHEHQHAAPSLGECRRRGR